LKLILDYDYHDSGQVRFIICVYLRIGEIVMKMKYISWVGLLLLTSGLYSRAKYGWDQRQQASMNEPATHQGVLSPQYNDPVFGKLKEQLLGESIGKMVKVMGDALSSDKSRDVMGKQLNRLLAREENNLVVVKGSPAVMQHNRKKAKSRMRVIHVLQNLVTN
jgi:hypothetical protein